MAFGDGRDRSAPAVARVLLDGGWAEVREEGGSWAVDGVRGTLDRATLERLGAARGIEWHGATGMPSGPAAVPDVPPPEPVPQTPVVPPGWLARKLAKGTMEENRAVRQEAAMLRERLAGYEEALARAGGASIPGIQAELRRLAGELAAAQAEARRVRGVLDGLWAEKARLRASIVRLEDEDALQDVGIYDYNHPLHDAEAYKSRLDAVRQKMKAMDKAGRAVSGVSGWAVNGSTAKGDQMVKQTSKLMLRAYNTEADATVRAMKPYKLEASKERLRKAVAGIKKLGTVMSIEISPAYHALRLEELELVADYLAKKAEEAEAARELKEQERDEAKARKEIEAARRKVAEALAREKAHFAQALARLEATGDESGIAQLRDRIEGLEAKDEELADWEGNGTAGYVYVISNIGSFGDRVVKIGMTRRMEPLDRIKELGDASVPFRFDVHTLVFSADARGLEAELHRRFAGRSVNLVNMRKEFFYATPAEVRGQIEAIGGDWVLEYVEEPAAEEWRASETARAGR